MSEYFVDTNIFLRFLIPENKFQYKIAKRLFEKAEQGKMKLWTTDVVILEIIWTLESFYKSLKTSIHKSVNEILALRGLTVNNSRLITNALKDFKEKNVDFADAYNYQLAKKEGKKILSFDKDFKKLGVKVDIKKVAK